jgi:hypothetical protein
MKKLIIICVLLICCIGYSQLPTNIVIGDSQTSYVDINSKKVNRVVGLWKKGNNVSNLTKMIKRQNVTPNVLNVFLCIGTNDLYVDKGIEKLFNSICVTFPNAKVYVIQGSWGWGNLKRVGYKKVRKYYRRYEELGGTLINPPIGKGDPHRNSPTYKKIGQVIDNILL